MREAPKARLILGALIACALWGSAFPCVKLGYEWGGIQGPASQILFAGIRFMTAGILTWLLGSFLAKKPLSLPKQTFKKAAFFGLIQTSLHYFLFYIALSYLSGSVGSMIDATSALFSILAAWILPPHERMGLFKIVGCSLGFAGILYLNYNGLSLGPTFTVGFVLMLSAAILQGLSNVLLSRISSSGSPFQITSVQLFIGGVVLLILGLLMNGRIENVTPAFLALLLYMSFLTTAAFSIWTSLMREYPVSKVSVFMFLIPIFGVLFSGLLLGEMVFNMTNMIALLLISSSILFVNKAF